MPACLTLSIIRYHLKKGVVPSLTPLCCSYLKSILWVTLDNGQPSYVHVCIYNIHIKCINKYMLATIVEDDMKDPFSIATTPRMLLLEKGDNIITEDINTNCDIQVDFLSRKKSLQNSYYHVKIWTFTTEWSTCGMILLTTHTTFTITPKFWLKQFPP